jgi:hypothetical protein
MALVTLLQANAHIRHKIRIAISGAIRTMGFALGILAQGLYARIRLAFVMWSKDSAKMASATTTPSLRACLATIKTHALFRIHAMGTATAWGNKTPHACQRTILARRKMR